MARRAELEQAHSISDLTQTRPVWGAIRSSVLSSGERRLEGESYLSDGYGFRLAVEAQRTGWVPLGAISRVWQPSRLKGIAVSPENGTPFLAAGQVFERRPVARKWLSLAQTETPSLRFVSRGVLLVSCSGNVGRVTIAHSPHEGKLITHDLLRVEPADPVQRGWLYAYMKTSQFREMATGTRYGHVVKHLEPEHLQDLPVVTVPPEMAKEFTERVDGIFAARDRAHALIAEAEETYAKRLGIDLSAVALDDAFSVSARELSHGRRRLDGFFYNRVAAKITSSLASTTLRVDTLADVCHRVFAPSRFSRTFGDTGVPYRSAEELFDLNPPVTKRIYASLVEDPEDYMLHPGWIVMACSGQLYGLNGAVALLNQRHAGTFASHDLIRIVPNESQIRPGYLLIALGHPTLGRPTIVRHGYGTSIPHLEPTDIARVSIPRLPEHIETSLAERIEEAERLRAEADNAEDEVVQVASDIVSKFMQGKRGMWGVE